MAFYDYVLVASDYFIERVIVVASTYDGVSRTCGLRLFRSEPHHCTVVLGYVECSRLETLVSYDFMDLVSEGASVLTS